MIHTKVFLWEKKHVKFFEEFFFFLKFSYLDNRFQHVAKNITGFL
jgi:hypothetical protein